MLRPPLLKESAGSVEDHLMADLSKVLGDVYGAGQPATPAAAPAPADAEAAPRREPAAPEWADDSRLDEAFANWNPGPGPDAPAAERDLFVNTPSRPLDEDLAAALSEALADAPVPAPIAPPAPPVAPANEAPSALRPSQSAAWLADVVRPDERPARVRPADVEPEPMVEASPEPAPAQAVDEPVADATPAPSMPLPSRAWQRSDDDVLAGTSARGGSSRRLAFSLRRG